MYDNKAYFILDFAVFVKRILVPMGKRNTFRDELDLYEEE